MTAALTGISPVAAVAPAARPGSAISHQGGFADLMKQAMVTATPAPGRKDQTPGKQEPQTKDAPAAEANGAHAGSPAGTPDAAPLAVAPEMQVVPTLDAMLQAVGAPASSPDAQASANQALKLPDHARASVPMSVSVAMEVAAAAEVASPGSAPASQGPVGSVLQNSGTPGQPAAPAPTTLPGKAQPVGASGLTPTATFTTAGSETAAAAPNPAAQALTLPIAATGRQSLTRASGNTSDPTVAAPGQSAQSTPAVRASGPAGAAPMPSVGAFSDATGAVAAGTPNSVPAGDAANTTADPGAPATAANHDPTPQPAPANAPSPLAAPAPAPALAAITIQATPQTAAAAPAPPTPGAFAEQVTKPVFTLASTAAPGEHVMVIKVTPDNLGPVTVQAHITSSSVRIELFAPTDAGREALRQVMPDLKRDIAASGLQTQLNLSSGNHPGAQQGDTGRNAFNQRASAPNPGTTNSRQLLMDTPSFVTRPGLSGTDAVLDVMA